MIGMSLILSVLGADFVIFSFMRFVRALLIMPFFVMFVFIMTDRGAMLPVIADFDSSCACADSLCVWPYTPETPISPPAKTAISNWFNLKFIFIIRFLLSQRYLIHQTPRFLQNIDQRLFGLLFKLNARQHALGALIQSQ